jgi:hypothetical protein
MAQIADSRSPKFPAESVKPNGAEYLVRADASLLRKISQPGAPYRRGIGLEPGSKPTNMAEAWYNPADETTVVLTLKRPGPGGASFLDYAFEDMQTGALFTAHYFFTCAGIRTANGQIYAVMARMGQGNDNSVWAIIMSFPSTVDGKSPISHHDEELEFRLVLNQRVFETKFIVNPRDLSDGTETLMRTPTRVDQLTPPTLP